MLQYFQPAGLHGQMKADRTPVTEADIAADRLINQAIRQNFPQDGIISEETNTHLEGTESQVWIVDPLDGTANFSSGNPIWGVSIARAVDGLLQTGVLYFPVTGELYTAERGRGATLNGQALQPQQEPLVKFFACCSRTHRNYRVNLRYKTRILGSVAYNLSLVARHQAYANLEVSPKIWDVAAGWLLVEEVGGAIEVIRGKSPFPAQPGIDYNQHRFSYLAAISPDFLQFVSNAIEPLDEVPS